MLVNAKVRSLLSDGLLVSFLTFFNGTVDCFHMHAVRRGALDELMRAADWLKQKGLVEEAQKGSEGRCSAAPLRLCAVRGIFNFHHRLLLQRAAPCAAPASRRLAA